MLTVGQRLWNGAIVTPYLVSAYNSIQAKIAQYEAQGKPVPENILNASFKLIAESV